MKTTQTKKKTFGASNLNSLTKAPTPSPTATNRKFLPAALEHRFRSPPPPRILACHPQLWIFDVAPVRPF